MNQHESTILVDFPPFSMIFFMIFSVSWSPAWNPWRNDESIESLIQGGRAEIESKEVGFENSWPFLSQRVDEISINFHKKIPEKVRRCTRPFVGLQAYWRWLGPKVGSSELQLFLPIHRCWVPWVPRPGLRRGPRVIDLDVVAVGQFPP